jgi:hypothetical protein
MSTVVTIDEKCGCRIVNATQCNPTRQFISFCTLHESAQKMRAALEKIARCKTRFKDSANCVEAMTHIALEVLPLKEPKQ